MSCSRFVIWKYLNVGKTGQFGTVRSMEQHFHLGTNLSLEIQTANRLLKNFEHITDFKSHENIKVGM